MKRFVAGFWVFFVGLLGLPGVAWAQNTICPEGQYEVLCNLDPNRNPDSVGNFVGDLVQFLIVLAIILSVLFLVWGGIRWIMSGGDKGRLDQARSTITAAIIGLVVSLLAFFIVSLLLQLFTGSGDLGGLKIPKLTD